MQGKRTRDYLYLQGIFLIYSFGTVASKKASGYQLLSPGFIKYYVIELIIIILYALLWQQIIKKFKLVTAYSSKAVVMLWTLIWSSIFFRESIRPANILGVIIIVSGILLVIRDDK